MRPPRIVMDAAAALAILGAIAGVAVHSARDAGATPLRVTGYAVAGDEGATKRATQKSLSTIAVDGVDITANGTSVGAPGAEANALLQQAHAGRKRAELLVGNYTEAVDDFDPAAAHRLFASATNRQRVIRTLVSVAQTGWDGLHLDFESLDGADRAGYTRFVTDLRAALPRRTGLSAAVMASTDAQGYRDAGYDLPALAGQLDRIVLMAYDQHGPGWSDAGPVGGMPWVRQTLDAMLDEVPAEKVDLGVAGYGYTWPAEGQGEAVSDAQARALGKNANWASVQAEWHATLADGGDLWWSDAKSFQARQKLAARQGLHGLAVWSLGLSDPIRL